MILMPSRKVTLGPVTGTLDMSLASSSGPVIDIDVDIQETGNPPELDAAHLAACMKLVTDYLCEASSVFSSSKLN